MCRIFYSENQQKNIYSSIISVAISAYIHYNVLYVIVIKSWGGTMSKIITASELKNAIQAQSYLKNGSEECAEGIKYDFRLGSRFLKAYFGRPIDFKDISSAEEIKKAVVEPGEVVFVLSRERISLPRNVYIQLNPKRSLSQDGIELLGGLTVDPGYEGHLVFGLRNVAGKPYILRPDTKLVGAHFFKLSEDEIVDDAVKPLSIDDFPQRLQELIEKYEPVNPQNLAEELRNLKRSFDEKQLQLANDVSALKAQVDAFSRELIAESTKRELETKQLNEKLADVSGKIDNLSKDNIKQETSLSTMQKTLEKVEEQTSILKDGAITLRGEKNIKSIVWTAIITFFITVVGGVFVYFLTR